MRASGRCRPSKKDVQVRRRCAFAAAILIAFLSLRAGAQSEQEIPASTVSLDRMKEELRKPRLQRLQLDVELDVPVATFKMRVDQRIADAYLITVEDQLRRQLTLTDLQRQSADWASRCCGINLLEVFKSVNKSVDEAMKRRQIRRIQEQIARELGELEARNEN
jgi:hypothetical protein